MGKQRGWGHSQCGWVRGLGGTYLERGRVEGGRDVSHSGWMAAWCLTMSKLRCQVTSISIQAYTFFFRSAHAGGLGAACGRHHTEKTATLPTSALLSPPSPQPRCRAVHGPHAYAHASGPQPHVFFATPASRRTAPQMTTRDESPHDHPGHAPFLWMRPGPLTCPAPSQRAAAIPYASHMPFMCPSPSHDLTHALRPPSMRWRSGCECFAA